MIRFNSKVHTNTFNRRKIVTFLQPSADLCYYGHPENKMQSWVFSIWPFLDEKLREGGLHIEREEHLYRNHINKFNKIRFRFIPFLVYTLQSFSFGLREI